MQQLGIAQACTARNVSTPQQPELTREVRTRMVDQEALPDRTCVGSTRSTGHLDVLLGRQLNGITQNDVNAANLSGVHRQHSHRLASEVDTGAHDNALRWEIHTRRQGGSGRQHTDVTVTIPCFNNCTLFNSHASVVHSNPHLKPLVLVERYASFFYHLQLDTHQCFALLRLYSTIHAQLVSTWPFVRSCDKRTLGVWP